MSTGRIDGSATSLHAEACLVMSGDTHKLAAHLAGLGWIGKSCLLVTPQARPRVPWTTVLTDAPLKSAGLTMKERCGDCQECVQVCPVNAFTARGTLRC